MEFVVDILIFDMDGVLIDVSKSYRKVIQQTAHLYLEYGLGMDANLVSTEEISLFKSVGGFNNDWDLASGLLLYLLSTSGIPPLRKQKKFSSIEEIVLYLRLNLSKFHRRKTAQLKGDQLSSFLEKVKTSGGGLRGVRLALKDSWEGWVYRSGDLRTENIVKRIFQEIYLGEKFRSYYHLQPLFYRGKGLYLREKLLIEKGVLSKLQKRLCLGIATGRPRFEAELALDRFHLRSYFRSLVTLDECEEEEARILRSTGKKIKLSKPHPYSILRIAKEAGIPNPQCGYVGDVVDDMVAARGAKKDLSILALGFLRGHRNRKAAKESLIRAGADWVIESPKELLCFVS